MSMQRVCSDILVAIELFTRCDFSSGRQAKADAQTKPGVRLTDY